MNIVSTCTTWLNLISSVPTDSLNLLGAVAWRVHTSHCFKILTMHLLVSLLMIPPAALLNSLCVAETNGCTKFLCILLSSTSVYRMNGISCESHLWMRKKFLTWNFCLRPECVTTSSCMLMSRPFSFRSFILNKDGMLRYGRSRNWTSITSPKSEKGMRIKTVPLVSWHLPIPLTLRPFESPFDSFRPKALQYDEYCCSDLIDVLLNPVSMRTPSKVGFFVLNSSCIVDVASRWLNVAVIPCTNDDLRDERFLRRYYKTLAPSIEMEHSKKFFIRHLGLDEVKNVCSKYRDVTK